MRVVEEKGRTANESDNSGSQCGGEAPWRHACSVVMMAGTENTETEAPRAVWLGYL